MGTFHPFDWFRMSKALFVFTSCGSYKKGEEEQQTGWYLPEAAHPHHILKDGGFVIDFASAKGEPSPVDEGSVKNFTDEQSVAFFKEHVEDGKLKNVKNLQNIDLSEYEIVFFPGGHGPMFDLANDEETAKKVGEFYEKKKGIVGGVCHGTAALIPVKLSDGTPLVKGQRVAMFTNNEEEAVGLSKFMPFMLETRLREMGATTCAVNNWQPLAVVSDRIVTGQNPSSGTEVGKELLAAAKANKK